MQDAEGTLSLCGLLSVPSPLLIPPSVSQHHQGGQDWACSQRPLTPGGTAVLLTPWGRAAQIMCLCLETSIYLCACVDCGQSPHEPKCGRNVFSSFLFQVLVPACDKNFLHK